MNHNNIHKLSYFCVALCCAVVAQDRSNSGEPESARTLARSSLVVSGIGVIVGIILLIVVIVLVVKKGEDGYNNNKDYIFNQWNQNN